MTTICAYVIYLNRQINTFIQHFTNMEREQLPREAGNRRGLGPQGQRNEAWFVTVLQQFWKNDFAYMFKIQGEVAKFIRKILRDPFQRDHYRPHFKRFLDVMEARIQPISFHSVIYHSLQEVQQQLKEAMEYEGEELEQPVSHITDSLFEQFGQFRQKNVRNFENQKYHDGFVDIKTKKTLSQRISQEPGFFKDGNWREIFALTINYIQNRYNDEEHVGETHIVPSPQIPNSNNKPVQSASSFELNSNLYNVQESPHILLAGNGAEIDSNADSIKTGVCALLNGGGGVVLFDCRRSYLNVLAKGWLLTASQKRECQQKLDALLAQISPKLTVNENIAISWVPLVYETQEASNFYILRVVVRPTKQNQPYSWKKHSPQGKIILRPQEKRVHERKEGSKLCKVCRKLDLKEQNSNEQIEEKLQALQFASIMIANEQDQEAIKTNLRRYGIQCSIRYPFNLPLCSNINCRRKKQHQSSNINQLKRSLPAMSCTAILYHNIQYKKLLYVVNGNLDFYINNKYLMVFQITQYIRLKDHNQSNPVLLGYFSTLYLWLEQLNAKATLKLWQLSTKKDREYYLQTGSDQSSVFLFLFFKKYKQRLSFQNPRLTDQSLKLVNSLP